MTTKVGWTSFNTNMPPLSDGELRQLENDDDKAGNKSDGMGGKNASNASRL